jgi:Fuc2NAc and GlcNAc transferase
MLAGLLAGAMVLMASGVLPSRDAVGLLGGATMIALVGWIDDRRSVAARHRALVHAAAAAWALYWLGGMPSLALGGHAFPLGLLGSALALVTIVWCTNLYNFMDGIDGIAGGQALVSGVFAGLLLVGRGGTVPGAVSLLVAAAAAGFLVWNWAPARIFMGDAGSGTLGFLFATLAVAAERDVPGSAIDFALLGAPFLLDATVTLLRRLLRGERWYDAHRSHAYQRAVQSGFSHRQVTSAVVLLTCCMGGLALASAARPHAQLAAAAAGYLIIALAYLWVEMRHPMAAT